MAIAIQDSLKEAGFTEGQIKVLTPVFEKFKASTNEHSFEFRVGAIEGKLAMLTWAIAVFVAVDLGTSTLLYQRTSSVETALNQRMDDLSADISEIKATQNHVQEEIREMKINQAIMQKDIKTLLERR